MSWKYIVVEVGNIGEVPIVFPSHMTHADVVRMVKNYYARQAYLMSGGIMRTKASLKGARDAVVPVSAGETVIQVESCSGGSETLQLDARGEKDRLLLSAAGRWLHGRK